MDGRKSAAHWFRLVLAILCVATASSITAASAAELPRGFVYLADVDPTIKQEMRYFGTHNFIGTRVRGYAAGECILTTRAARALKVVQDGLRPRGYSLKVYDCYRPMRAVAHFVEWAADPQQQEMKRSFYPRIDKATLFARKLIAKRSKHSRGSTIDLALTRLTDPAVTALDRPEMLTACDAPKDVRFNENSLDLGTNVDCFSTLSETANPQVSAEAKKNRALLVSEMAKAGFQNYRREWWHFELIDEPYKKTGFDFVVEPRPVKP